MDSDNLCLSRLNGRLRSCFSSDPLLRVFLEDGYFWSGQGIRGQVCIRIASCLGLDDELALDVATFTELLHNASLVHDDLIDEDVERRGHQSVWKKYGHSQALILGDLLIAQAFNIATSSKAPDSVKTAWTACLAETMTATIRGVNAELSHDFKHSSDILTDYLKMAGDKTGSMFALPIHCLCSALTMKATETEQLCHAFSNLAVAYQIKDDEADYLGTKIGRSTSSDALNGRPNIYHLLGCEKTNSDKIMDRISLVHQNLILEAKKSLEGFHFSLNQVLDELVIPFVQLSGSLSPVQSEVIFSDQYEQQSSVSLQEDVVRSQV